MPYANDGHDVPDYVTGSAKRKRQWAHVWNSEYKRQKDKGKSDKEAEQIAFASANSIAGPNSQKKFTKADDDAKEFADALASVLEQEFLQLPVEVRKSLEQAALSGASNGLLQIEFSNSGLLAEANKLAQDYATERAAELIGMKYDADGNLITNPNAKWAISETTRDEIRELVADAFAQSTDRNEIKAAIQESLRKQSEGNGIFSAGRASMIARTEIMRAQTSGNFEMWKKSGLVKSIKWSTSEDEKVCEECSGNDGKVVKIGQAFPSGAKFPPDHPSCRCVAIVHETV